SSAEQGRLDDAVEWYQRTLAITPDFAKAHTNLCYLLWSAERFAAAADACRNGVRYAPAHANLLKLLGLRLVGMGSTDEGAMVLARSRVVGEPDDELRTYLARLQRAAAEPHSNALDAPRAHTVDLRDAIE